MPIESPEDIPNCRVWMEPHDSGTVSLSGENVTEIRNKSVYGGSNQDWNTPRGAGAMIRAGDNLNGTQVMYMPGAIRGNSNADLPSYLGSQTIFVVTKDWVQDGGTQRILGHHTNTKAVSMEIFDSGGMRIGAGNYSSTLTNVMMANKSFLWIIHADNAGAAYVEQREMLADGWGAPVVSDPVDIGAVEAFRFTVGGNDSGTLGFDQYYGTTIVYDRALTGGEVEDVVTYIGEDYGLGLPPQLSNLTVDMKDTTATMTVDCDQAGVKIYGCFRKKEPGVFESWPDATTADKEAFRDDALVGRDSPTTDIPWGDEIISVIGTNTFTVSGIEAVTEYCYGAVPLKEGA